MAEKILACGAEALIIEKSSSIIKKRVPKGYRLKEIDEKLRVQRTKREAKILKKASGLIFVPRVIKIDKTEIEMEFIQGQKLSDHLDSFSLEKQRGIAFKIGEEVSKLHEANVIHSDLTTSNMILKDSRVYFIDFGLSFISSRLEDKAVDLHLLRQALESKHFKHWLELFNQVKEGYKRYSEHGLVLKQLEKVEKRGRYKGGY